MEQRLQLNKNVTLLETKNKTSLDRSTSLNISRHNWFEDIFSEDYVIIYYSVLFALMTIVVFSRSLLLYRWSNAASTKMHNTMFTNIVYSPMKFFQINPSGRILNRFSKDIGAVDETLPMTILDTVQVSVIIITTNLLFLDLPVIC